MMGLVVVVVVVMVVIITIDLFPLSNIPGSNGDNLCPIVVMRNILQIGNWNMDCFNEKVFWSINIIHMEDGPKMLFLLDRMRR